MPRLETLRLDELAGPTPTSERGSLDSAQRSYRASNASRWEGLPLLHCALLQQLRALLDRGAALALLIAAAPVMVVAAGLIFASDWRSPVFKQQRVGYARRPFGAPEFTLYKIRSMAWGAEKQLEELSCPDALNDGVRFKRRDDPRISATGRWIRRLSIDELPQLWNVVRGDMALVGPRPPVQSETLRYTTAQRARIHGLPGLTGPWQVAGRAEISFSRQALMDRDYLATQSLRGDIALLLRTLPAVLSTRGAW